MEQQKEELVMHYLATVSVPGFTLSTAAVEFIIVFILGFIVGKKF